MQCKDIPTDAVLRFLALHQGRWATWFPPVEGSMPSVLEAMPAVPGKLALAKMRQLHRAGLVGGCPCGCRGDFEITDKGLARIGVERSVRYNGYGERRA